MSTRTHTVEHDGRSLHVFEDGDPGGLPVFVHHGTPGCGQFYAPHAEDARARGIRLLSASRPGYGDSTRAEGRSVADVAADVAAIADQLGVGRFATWGVSGGGPHTLACAALLPDRVLAAAAVASIAPFDAPGLNWFAGMGEDNLRATGATLMGGQPHAELAEEMAAGMLAADPDEMIESIASLVGPRDREALTPQFTAFLAEETRQGLAPGIGGWLDDDLVAIRPWGFDPGSISVPVLVLHGRDDRFVPVAHGEWLGATIPGADVRISARDGHLSIGLDIGPVHEWLLSHA